MKNCRAAGPVSSAVLSRVSLVLSMIRTARDLPFKSWVKKPGKKGWPPLVSVKRLAEVGCAKLGEVAESEEKTQLFLETMDKLFATDTREHWVKALRDADIVCAPINTVLEASKDPDVIANKYIIEVDHPKAGKIKEVGFPWKFSKFHTQGRHRARTG